MRYVLVVLGCIILAIAAVALWGWLLPEKHVASRKARYRQTPEALWSAITSYKGDEGLTYKIEESNAPAKLVTRVIDPHHNFGGTWTYEIQPAEGGSVLQITECGEVYNPIFRFVSRYIMGHMGTIDAALKAFAAQFHEQI